MGRTLTPTYRLETQGPSDIGSLGRSLDGRWAVCTWPKGHRPTAANIDSHLRAIVASMMPGGCNAHIGRAIGRLPMLPARARVVRQSTGAIVAAWEHPTFMAI